MYDWMNYGIAISFFNTPARYTCKMNLPAEYRLSILYLSMYLIGKTNEPYKYVIYRCIVMIENWNYRFDWIAIFVSHFILLTLLSCIFTHTLWGQRKREPANEALPFHVCQGCWKIFPIVEKFIIPCKYIYPFMIWISFMKIWIGS